MLKKAILFLGTSLIGALYTKEAAKRLGFEAIFLLHLRDYSGEPALAIQAGKHYETNVNSVTDIVRVIKENELMRKYNIIGITSFLDETFPVVLSVANKFNILGPDSALINLTDKAYVQQLIPEFSPPSLNFLSEELSEKVLAEFFKIHDYVDEFILKPSISSGAVGVSVLSKREISFEKIKQLIQDSSLENAQQHWLLQTRISGRLYSLEGYVEKGNVFLLGFSRRVRKELTEMINEYPVDQDLSEEVRQRCQAAVQALVNRSGYSHGYFHCEFIISDSETYLIDSNMGRLSGGGFAKQLAVFYELDPIDILKHVIDLGLFKSEHMVDYRYQKYKVPTRRTLTINYCIKDLATVLNVTFPENGITTFHVQLADGGRLMPGVGSNDSAWVGFLVGYSEEVLKDIEKIAINTNNGLVKPFYIFTEEEPTGIIQKIF